MMKRSSTLLRLVFVAFILLFTSGISLEAQSQAQNQA